MFNKSIAYRLSIFISLAIITVFMIFIAIAYSFNSAILKSNIENKALELSQGAMNIAEKQLSTTREVSFNISDQVLYFAKNNETEQLLTKLMKNYPFMNAIHVNIDSSVPNIPFHNYFIYHNSDSLVVEKINGKIYRCKNEERIFEGIIKNSGSGWSEVFKCSRNNSPVVSFYTPIIIPDKNNKMVAMGSVIVELKLQQLVEAINSIKIGKSGYAVMVSQDGTYLAHPNKEWVLHRNLADISKEEYNASKEEIQYLLKHGEKGSVIAYPKYLNYQKCWVHYTQIEETGWTILFIVPYNELFVPLYLLILRMLFFSVLGILIIFFIVTYLSNKLIQPLSNVTSQLKKFSSANGDFELNTQNEVELVSGSLEFLKNWYDQFKIDRFHEENLKIQSRQDLLEASEVQMSLINQDFKVFDERNDVDLFALYKPARIVSGDLYDFIFLDDDTLFFSIGDVSGKGVSAAFFMSVAQTLLKRNAKSKSPESIVNKVNKEISTTNQHQFFVTLFVGLLNLKTGELQYCNAAHTPSLLIHSDCSISELKKTHGMPLGLFQNRGYKQSSIIIAPGDSIVLYSDGVTDQQNLVGEYFGIERLTESVKKVSECNPRNVVAQIASDLEIFDTNAKQSDDITLMVIQFKKKEA